MILLYSLISSHDQFYYLTQSNDISCFIEHRIETSKTVVFFKQYKSKDY